MRYLLLASLLVFSCANGNSNKIAAGEDMMASPAGLPPPEAPADVNDVAAKMTANPGEDVEVIAAAGQAEPPQAEQEQEQPTQKDKPRTEGKQDKPRQTKKIERKLIKNGDMTLEVADLEKAHASVASLIKSMDGYLSNESQYNDNFRRQYQYTLRIPAAKFDTTLTALEGLAKNLESKNIRTEDVTEQFVDLTARLRTKLDLEARYREILKQAHTVDEILSIESQIANVRGEVESMQGRLNYLSNQVSFSTLNLTIYQSVSVDFGFGSKIAEALGSGWDNLLSFLVGLVTAWPFLLIATGGTWLFLRWRKRRKANG